MDTRTILFIGKPGSGKGTQAKLISEKTGWSVFSSGDAFRAIAKEETPIGAKVKHDVDNGLLMPDWFASYLFQKTAFSIAPESGVIFDGFARKVPEARIVSDTLIWLERPFKVVHIKVSDDNIRDRLTKRRAIENRVDDNSIEKRLEEYRTFTEPTIDAFREKGLLIEVDGNGTVEDIHKEIAAQIGLA